MKPKTPSEKRDSAVRRTKPSSLFFTVLEGHRQWPSLQGICQRLTAAGFDAVLAGGSVRDLLMGRAPQDFDVATGATPDVVETLFEKTVAVGKSFGVIVVISADGASIEVATYRQDGAYEDGRRPTGVVFTDRKEDALRRDFTVNALFYDPASREIIDVTGGLEDLENKILRAVGDPVRRFEEDKLRMLRAVRFTGQLGFEIETGTAEAIRRHAGNLGQVSRERIRDEIDKLLLSENPQKGFSAISDLNLSEPVFEDWAKWILPIDPRVCERDLDVQRALLFYPALKHQTQDRIQDRLKGWKYGRSFIELVLWMMKNESALRVSTDDPVRELAARAKIVDEFSAATPEERAHSASELEWMTALELWTDERAIKAVSILDRIYGVDPRREAGLLRRGLSLGNQSGSLTGIRARAEDLQAHQISGPELGRALQRLGREILLGKGAD